MFNPSILELQSQIHYYQEQQELAEQELDRLKMTQAFAEDAAEKVEDALEHIEPKYVDVFREHLLSLFPTDGPVCLEEKEPKVFNPPQPDIPHTPNEDEEQEAEHLEDYPKELIIEGLTLKQAKELTETCDFSNPPIQEPVEVREELYKKPHYPDPKIPIKLADYKEGMTPVNKVEISPEIIYISVDKTAYVAMKAKGRARTYGDMLTRVLTIGSKYLVTDKLTVIKNAKYEFRIFDISFEDVKQLAKFNLSKDYDHKENKEVREVWRTTRKREVPSAYKASPKLVPLEEIKLGDIVYLNSINNQYKVLNKVELDGVPHIEVICVYNSERPSLVSEISYLKECYLVPTENIQIDPQFQSLEKPEVKKSGGLTTDDFPPAPYNLISLNQIELCDVVTTSPNSQSAYEVKEHKGSYIVTTCLYHNDLPNRVGENFTFSDKVYLVEKGNNSMLLTEFVEPVPLATHFVHRSAS